VSIDKINQFYVDELHPFVSASVSRQPDGLQQRIMAEARDHTDTSNTTLYGSTQLAVDLAELAAEAGNETLAADVGSSACSQTQPATKESSEILTVVNNHSEEKMPPADAPIALDGFCLQSSSVSFMPFINVVLTL